MLSFYEHATARGFVVIKFPLAHLSDTFIGQAPRPIMPKNSARVMRSHTPEGGSIAIRYEGTAPAARYVAGLSHEHDFGGARLAYFDEMYRLEMEDELDDRHFRAFHQAGIECFHSEIGAHHQAMTDLLRVNRDWVRAMGAALKIRVSHVDLVPRALGAESLKGADARALRRALENETPSDIEARLDTLVASAALRARGMHLAALRDVPLDQAVRELEKRPEYGVAEAVRVFADRVARADLGDIVRFDAGILRSLNFYSGLTFQGDVDEVREVLGGGEYSGLAEAFGARGHLHAVGTAIGVERLQSVVAAESLRAA
jgi:histidyl-tRNA synthetase